MNYPLRSLFGLLLVVTGLASTPSLAATVEAINKAQSRVILKLTQVELAAVEDEQTVLIEVAARPAFVVSGTLTKVNPLKKTVVVILEGPDARFGKKQGVQFLSLFFNPLFSPLMTSYSQYHQYGRSSVEGGLGMVYDKFLQKVGDSRQKSVLAGTLFAVDGYALVSPRLFGAGFGFRHFAGTVDASFDGGKYKADVTINQLRPGAWFEFQDGWVLGARYDYTLFDDDTKPDGPSFSYDLGGMVWGVTHYSPDFEYGFTYKEKTKFTAIDSQTDLAGKSVTVENTMKTPAVLDLSFRDITSPLFGWGMGIGYVFYERELVRGETLRTKPTAGELLRGRLTMEWRLDDGSKVDAALTYAGGRDSSFLLSDNVANKVGTDLTYVQPVFEHFLVGGTMTVQGGAISIDEEGEAKSRETTTREVQTFGASLLLFGRYELDLLDKGRKRGI